MTNVKRVCLLCVAVVWLFCFGVMTGTFIVRYQYKKMLEPTAEAIQQTAEQQGASSTDAESTTREGIHISLVTDPTLPISETYTGLQDVPGLPDLTGVTQTPLPNEKNEIISSLIKAINTTKESTGFTVIKSQTFSIIKDSFTGGNLAATTFDDIIKDISRKPPQTRTFSGNREKQGDPNDFIPPASKEATILSTAVKSCASGKNTDDDGYTIKIDFNDESRSLNNTTGGMGGIFDFPTSTSFDLPEGVYLTGLDLMIMGGTVTADIDRDGKLESIKYVLPIASGKCTASVAGVEAMVKFHGEYTCTMNFSHG